MDLTEFIIRLLLSAIAVFISARILSGVKVDSFRQSVIVAIVLGVINAIVKPILVFLTIPITIITLGLFLLVINALMIMLVDKIMKGFKVKSFWWAFFFSIILSVLNAILQSLF
ncbi:phage holin family protein [Marivirga sp.]|uniref:phage holin family protein n=1 Tax=Marivirga sp. TaxID=2018662 RepID=UPI002D811715|nr:phage holin family protein [Marivirga sp.]HET8859600.1 phage holin family protein [Marivirga sp.]